MVSSLNRWTISMSDESGNREIDLLLETLVPSIWTKNIPLNSEYCRSGMETYH